MSQLSWQAVYDLVCAHGARPGADLCACAAADSESGRDPLSPPGDNGISWGLWMMEQGAGLGGDHSAAELQDPDFAAEIMVPLFNQTYQDGLKAGYTGEELVRYCCMYAERPLGFPNLHSPAANRYAASWFAAVAALSGEEPTPMTFDPDQPAELQIQPWSCSIRTATWLLKSIGVATDASRMQDAMVPAYVTPALGLLQGDGSGLADVLAEQSGCPTGHQWVDWQWLLDHAGAQPIGIGGIAWNHWVGVRRVTDRGTLAIANPAPSWMGVNTELTEADMARLGPFAAVWITLPEEDQLSAEDRAELDRLKSFEASIYADTLNPIAATLDQALAVKGTKGWGKVAEVRQSLKQNAGV